MVAKAERNFRDELWLNPKANVEKWVFSSELPKEKSMVNVQRSSPGRRVEPQANGGRKIQLLRNKDVYMIYTLFEKIVAQMCSYKVAFIRKIY